MIAAQQCGLQAPGSCVYRWPPGTEITWALDPTSPLPAGLGDYERIAGVISAGIAPWAAVCSADIVASNDASSARVRVVFEYLDLVGRILGLTDLPAGQAQCTLRLNLDFDWTDEQLAQISMHEFGHALGLVHCDPALAAIMNPVYQPQLPGPTDSDVAQARLRYPVDSTPPAAAALTLERKLHFGATFDISGAPFFAVVVPGGRALHIPVELPESGEYWFTFAVSRAPS